MTRFPELAFYGLAGATESPRELIAEVSVGERLGFGTVFLSERLNVKEAATLSGVAAAASDTIKIATAATNHNTRHPLVAAAHALTMHRLTAGRYTLGLGRGSDTVFARMGLPPITTAEMEDFAGLLRRLFRGETIEDHRGPAGAYPLLELTSAPGADIPLGMVAFGPNSLALAGRAFDMVVLHTFFTDETLERCVRTVRESAERAGRDPGAVQVWSCLATLGDHLPADVLLKKSVGRLATYLQAYGDLLVATNRWDPAVLRRFRADPLVQSFGRMPIDAAADTNQLSALAELIPDEWSAAAANGTPEQCVTAVERQLDLGATGVIMHGASPSDLRPIIEAYGSTH